MFRFCCNSPRTTLVERGAILLAVGLHAVALFAASTTENRAPSSLLLTQPAKLQESVLVDVWAADSNQPELDQLPSGASASAAPVLPSSSPASKVLSPRSLVSASHTPPKSGKKMMVITGKPATSLLRDELSDSEQSSDVGNETVAPTTDAGVAAKDALAGLSDGVGNQSDGGHGKGDGSGRGQAAGRGDGRLRSPRLVEALSCNDLYPWEAEQDSITLAIEVSVLGSGTATLSRVLGKDTPSEFRRAARFCAQRLRFTPARDKSGRTIASSATVRLHFSRS